MEGLFMEVYVVLMDAENDMTYEDHWYTRGEFIGVYASKEKAIEAILSETTKERIYEREWFDDIDEKYRDEWFERQVYERDEIMTLEKCGRGNELVYHAVRVTYEDFGCITADYYIKPYKI
jgi:hypothetical protein